MRKIKIGIDKWLEWLIDNKVIPIKTRKMKLLYEIYFYTATFSLLVTIYKCARMYIFREHIIELAEET